MKSNIALKLFKFYSKSVALFKSYKKIIMLYNMLEIDLQWKENL